MNTIKFSHDYSKLPPKWDGTQALLVGVGDIEGMSEFKQKYPQIMSYDTTFRDEEGSYPIEFQDGLLLTFFHFDSKTLFTTIRRFTPEKANYYYSKEMEVFELMRVAE